MSGNNEPNLVGDSQSALFESLLVKFVNVVDLTKDASGSPQKTRQALLHATNEFKAALSRAKEYAEKIPGGELLVEEQDDLLQLLQSIKEGKQQQLLRFSQTEIISKEDMSTKMETDSNASTPEKVTH